MTEWDKGKAQDWVLEFISNDPAGRPSGLGALIAEGKLGDEHPPWNLVQEAIDLLVARGLIDAIPKHTMPSDGSPAFYIGVKLTSSGLLSLED